MARIFHSTVGSAGSCIRFVPIASTRGSARKAGCYSKRSPRAPPKHLLLILLYLLRNWRDECDHQIRLSDKLEKVMSSRSRSDLTGEPQIVRAVSFCQIDPQEKFGDNFCLRSGSAPPLVSCFMGASHCRDYTPAITVANPRMKRGAIPMKIEIWPTAKNYPVRVQPAQDPASRD